MAAGTHGVQPLMGQMDVWLGQTAEGHADGQTGWCDHSCAPQALGPYSVSKTALLGLVKVLAPELRARGVRLNAVAPGLIQTRFSAAVRAGGSWEWGAWGGAVGRCSEPCGGERRGVELCLGCGSENDRITRLGRTCRSILSSQGV